MAITSFAVLSFGVGMVIIGILITGVTSVGISPMEGNLCLVKPPGVAVLAEAGVLSILL